MGGFFVDKNNSAEGVYEARTGVTNVSEVGAMVSYQGNTELDLWQTDDCNRIRGTDGSIFHPDISRDDTLYIFNMNLCQSLPIVYQKDVMHHGMNTYRFVLP